MSSLRRLRKGLRNLEERADELEQRVTAKEIRPVLNLRLEDGYYVSAETGVPWAKAEEVFPEADPPYPPGHLVFLSKSAVEEDAETLAPLFGDPQETEPVDEEQWAIASQAFHSGRDDDPGGSSGGDPEDGSSSPPRAGRSHARRKGASVDFRV